MAYSSYHKRAISSRELHPETQMMSYGYDPFLSEGAVKPPVFLTSTFAFRTAEDGAAFFDVVAGRKPAPQDTGAGLVYSRFNHPNLEIVEDRLALLDDAEDAIVTSSGMAAIAAVLLTFLRPGDQIVHSTPLYGGTETLIRKVLPEWKISGQPFTDGLSREQMDAALEAAAARGRVGLFYVETPAESNQLHDRSEGCRGGDRGLPAAPRLSSSFRVRQHDAGADFPIPDTRRHRSVRLFVDEVRRRAQRPRCRRRDRAARTDQPLAAASQCLRLATGPALVLDDRSFDGDSGIADAPRCRHREPRRALAGDKSDPPGSGAAPATDRRSDLPRGLPQTMHRRRLHLFVRAARAAGMWRSAF